MLRKRKKDSCASEESCGGHNLHHLRAIQSSEATLRALLRSSKRGVEVLPTGEASKEGRAHTRTLSKLGLS
jgi:hypothetical protein